MVTRKVLYVKLAKTCLAAALAASITFAADAEDMSGVKLKVTGVAVVDETQENRADARRRSVGQALCAVSRRV